MQLALAHAKGEVKGGREKPTTLITIDAEDYALRYAFCFPIDSTEWRKITVPWRDLIPELPAGKPVDAEKGYPPSRFANIWFGKWYYWGDYPACSFAVDQVALEQTIPLEPTPPLPEKPGVARLLANLRAKQPVTIVTMGDSLSDKRHWANREGLWSEVQAGKLSDDVDGPAEVYQSTGWSCGPAATAWAPRIPSG